jgi:hypothetical protein
MSFTINCILVYSVFLNRFIKKNQLIYMFSFYKIKKYTCELIMIKLIRNVMSYLVKQKIIV